MTSFQKAKQALRAALHRILPAGSRRGRAARRLYDQLRGQPPAAPGVDVYPAWAASRDASPAELAGQRAGATSLPILPKFSIITPVYNPPADILRTTLDSVLAQSYPGWELCLAIGGAAPPDLRAVLDDAAARDQRIRVEYLPENLGISGNSNAALRIASGEFLLLMDHDDLLAPDLLFEAARLINDQPDVDIIYTDEDKVDADGKTRRNPLFKPDWSPEMLLSANYLTHPILRRALVEQVGPFDPRYDGTQDWDLMFRCTEQTARVAHIPRVLYHWREVSGSTAAAFTAKSYVFDRQLDCISAHLERTRRGGGQAVFERTGIVRVRWSFSTPRVSIIIPNKDHPELLRRFLGGLLEKTRYPDYEVILVDTGSSDTDTLAYYEELSGDPRFRLVHFSGPFNFSGACNLGAHSASGDLLLFLNNDIEVLEGDWLEELARWAMLPEIGAVGAKLLYPDGTLQHAGIVLGLNGHADHLFLAQPEGCGGIFGSSDWYRNVLAVTGACLMIRRQVFDQVGGWDERFGLVYNDVALCLAVHQTGRRVLYNPFVRLVHHQGSSRGSFMPTADMRLAYEEFRPYIQQGDPFFNTNLSYSSAAPVLAGPAEPDRLARVEGFIAVAEKAELTRAPQSSSGG